MKKIIIIVITIVSALAVFIYKNSGRPYLRVENASDYNFDEVIVGRKDYGAILSKEKSDYKQFEKAYRYNYIKVRIKDKKYEIIPTDFVGEASLPRGNYTYVLDLDLNEETYNALSLKIHPYRRNMIDVFDINIRAFYNRHFGKRFGYI